MAVVRKEGIKTAMRDARARTAKAWRPHRSLMIFLQDHFPQEWEKVQRCRMVFKVYESKDRPSYYKVVGMPCKQLPYCINCASFAGWRRAMKAMDRFHRCTPKGQKPRFIHIVQTAPVGERPGDWGNEACKDVATFGRVVWEGLREIYGSDIGAMMSYHDFGEKAFAMTHPHWDLTLNGWTLVDGEATETPKVELKGGGDRRWIEAMVNAARKRWPDAAGGHFDVRAPRVGVRAYKRALQYQMRELVDLRKLEYSRSDGTVHWLSYKDNRRERFTVEEFLMGLGEYEQRLGQWGSGKRQMLHKNYGHMSDRRANETQRVMGGEAWGHGEACACSECEDWEVVYLRELTDHIDVR